jgi:hypothetical protein
VLRNFYPNEETVRRQLIYSHFIECQLIDSLTH